MSGELTFRMLRERIASGQATGILCPPEAVESWRRRLEQEIPLLQRIGVETLYFHTGAIIVFCSTPEAAMDWEGRHKGPVLWIDDDNLLDAPLPAPKPVPER